MGIEAEVEREARGVDWCFEREFERDGIVDAVAA